MLFSSIRMGIPGVEIFRTGDRSRIKISSPRLALHKRILPLCVQFPNTRILIPSYSRNALSNFTPQPNQGSRLRRHCELRRML